MKKIIFIMVLGALFIGNISGILVDRCVATEEYIISMDEPTYEFVSSMEKGERIYSTFNINVILHNSGTAITPKIVVELTDDDEIPMYRNGTIDPGDSKSFVFNNVVFRPVEGKNEYNAYISYYPEDNYLQDDENQGETTLILKLPGDDEDDSSGDDEQADS